MSTRCTIGYGDYYHLYEECFDTDKVWLEIENKVSDVEYRSSPNGELIVGIDVTVWRKIVEAWLQSHWAKNPERDHQKIEIDAEYIEELIKNFENKKMENKNE
jgi:hypothetical protein